MTLPTATIRGSRSAAALAHARAWLRSAARGASGAVVLATLVAVPILGGGWLAERARAIREREAVVIIRELRRAVALHEAQLAQPPPELESTLDACMTFDNGHWLPCARSLLGGAP